jgi:hypothetical protein
MTAFVLCGLEESLITVLAILIASFQSKLGSYSIGPMTTQPKLQTQVGVTFFFLFLAILDCSI